MKIRKIDGLFWAVIERTDSIFIGIHTDIKKSVEMCIQQYVKTVK